MLHRRSQAWWTLPPRKCHCEACGAAAGVRQCGGFGLRRCFVILVPRTVISSCRPTRRLSSDRSKTQIRKQYLFHRDFSFTGSRPERGAARRGEAKANHPTFLYWLSSMLMEYNVGMPTAVTPKGRPRDPTVDRRVLTSDDRPSPRAGRGGHHGQCRGPPSRRRTGLDLPALSEPGSPHSAAIRAAIGHEPNPGQRRPRAGHPPHRRASARHLFVAAAPAAAAPADRGPAPAEELPDGPHLRHPRPNRSLLADEYRELAAAAGFRTDVDPEAVFDLIVGPILNRLLVTGAAPSQTMSMRWWTCSSMDSGLGDLRISTPSVSRWSAYWRSIGS